MENPHKLLHPLLDFAKSISYEHPGQLSLWSVLDRIGFVRGLSQRFFLSELKAFLTGPDAELVTHFNFEKNFNSLAQDHNDFKLFIDMLAENHSIKRLEIGNNYVPANLRDALVKVLTEKKLIELSFRMHWYPESDHNMLFITSLAQQLHQCLHLEKIDLSGNHINEEGLRALADACSRLPFLMKIDLSNVTYVNMTPQVAYNFWLQINTILKEHRDFEDLIRAMPPTPPLEDSHLAADKFHSTPPTSITKSSQERLDQSMSPYASTKKPGNIIETTSDYLSPELPRATRCPTLSSIAKSDDELSPEFPLPKVKKVKTVEPVRFIPAKKTNDVKPFTFFKQNDHSQSMVGSTVIKTFTERLEAIEIDINTNNVFGIKALEIIYYEQDGMTCHKKIMEDPHVLFYRHKGKTYMRNYDGNYIKKWVQMKNYDPFTLREFDRYYKCHIMPNPYMKHEIDKLIRDLENNHQLTYNSRLY